MCDPGAQFWPTNICLLQTHALASTQARLFHRSLSASRRRARLGCWTMPASWASGLALPALSLLVSLALPLAEPQQLVSVNVSTGQQLADAIADWGASGSNMTILIDVPYISMRDASIRYSSVSAINSTMRPFSQGVLTVRGSTTSATVLDAGKRAFVVPVLGYPAYYSLENLVLINSCEDEYVINPRYSTTFGLSISYPSQQFVNTTVYVSQADVASKSYEVIMQASSIPELESKRSDASPEKYIVYTVDFESSPYVQAVEFFEWSLGSYYNVTIRSLANPDDPLLRQLKAEGKIMPLQYCNGSMVPDSFSEVNPYVGPFRCTTDQAGFVTSLQRSVDQTAYQLQFKGPPAALMLVTGKYAVPDGSTYTIASSMFVTGRAPLLGTPDSGKAWLDFRQRVGFFSLAPGAQMMFQWLILTGLAAQVPTQLPAGLAPDSNLLPSVFPLAAFMAADGSAGSRAPTYVAMSNATLVIPPDDFLALLILASRQAGQDIGTCADAETIQRVTQLQAGFTKLSVFSLPGGVGGEQQALVLRDLQGWGLNATMLRLLPTTPIQQPACPRSSHMTSSNTIGLAVGLACGAFLLLVALLAWGLWHRSQRALQESASANKTVDVACSDIGQASDSEHLSSSVTPTASVEILMFDVSNCDQDVSPGRVSSPLHSGVQEARASHQRLLASAAGLGPEQRSGQATNMLTSDAIREQIQAIAAQLNEADQLTLAGVLGSGSSGTVFMGLWKGLQVAVKTIIIHHGPAHGRKPACLEAAIAASLRHPNVVAAYRYDVKALATCEPGEQAAGSLQMTSHVNDDARAYKLFLIQELCDLSLSAAVSAGLFFFKGTEILDVGSVLFVLLDVAQGLAYLHSQGIIHGDLKPDNIMLKLDKNSANGIVAKLADFGLSRKLGPNCTHVSNVGYGTPFYIAPETAISHQMSPASDMYSFGTIMWVLFAQQDLHVMTPDGQPVPNPLYPDMPPGVSVSGETISLMRRCCCYKSQARPSASEAVATLKHALHVVLK